MNKRIKEVIVVIQNSKIIYADTNLDTFFKVLRALEPTSPSKQTIRGKLNRVGFLYFTNERGTPYHVCSFENPDYFGLKGD
ncbi:MAG TPA: hypothetical protein VFF15_01395 [Flavobacteriaceae bacterium]|nr:hypothetical protein [Flavobacteriaceae bacterium]